MMTSQRTTWGDGYVAGSRYAIAWQPAATPAQIAMVCAMAGIRWEPRARMTVADLGCGRGYNANLLAAANPDWTVLGIDQEPSAIAEAMQTAAIAGLSNTLFAEADLGAMDDAAIERLPPLDVVLLHGVWSWVSDAVRAGILKLLARRLKPGGVAYIGYNALPAAGPDLALQRLLRHLAGRFGPGEGSEAAARAMARLREIGEALPLPRTAMRNRLMADPPGLEPGFVAHEFLTAHWRPVFQADLARDVAAAKLEFVGSANLFETLPGLFCDAEQMSLMGRMGDAMEPREFLKDLCLPRHFRADVFIRGARPLAQLAALDDIALAACRDLPADTPPLNTGASKVALQQGVWEVIAARLAAGPIRLGALRQGLGEGAPHPAEILALLVGTDHALPYFRDAGPQPAATRFNIAAAAIHAANGEGEGQLALAAPHALGGIAASATELALVGQLLQGADPARPAWMAAQLQPGLADAALELATARIAELLADRFPVWRRFGVV